MIKTFKCLFVLLFFVCTCSLGQSTAISTAILNFGGITCGNGTAVIFSLIGTPLTTPYSMATCAINPPFGNVYAKYIAYNPRDNKVYVNDIAGNNSRLYIYNMGLPVSYTCPGSMPLTPTYSYLYVPNNFEFDINGDVWAIRGLSGSTAIIERIDEATGTILFSKTLDFPAGQVPNNITSGDIVITPNGRMFIISGDNPGRFYEVNNYAASIGNATATYIQSMPRPCYGILYANGTIQLTGTDFGGGCYRYVYDLSSQLMGTEQAFPLGQMPVDNSSISPATGISKRLVGSASVDSITADLVYEIDAKNMGNVKLDNFNVSEDLASVFGANNISNVDVTIQPGDNPCNLVLENNFNGDNKILIFKKDQILSNLQTGYVKFSIALRVTNLIRNKIYYNTAISSGEIGNHGGRVIVVDSSNNGWASAIDPNLDGDAGEAAENKPTPYFFGNILPLKFIDIKAGRVSNNLHSIRWSIAPPPSPVTKFEIEVSEDHSNWQIAGTVPGQEAKNDYSLNYHTGNTNTLFYRVRAFENTGKTYLSAEAVVKQIQDEQNIKVTPNPADDFITVSSSDNNFTESRRVQIIDVSGKKIFDQPYSKQNMEIRTSQYPNGYYVVNIINRGNIFSTQVLIKHIK